MSLRGRVEDTPTRMRRANNPLRNRGVGWSPILALTLTCRWQGLQMSGTGPLKFLRTKSNQWIRHGYMLEHHEWWMRLQSLAPCITVIKLLTSKIIRPTETTARVLITELRNMIKAHTSFMWIFLQLFYSRFYSKKLRGEGSIREWTRIKPETKLCKIQILEQEGFEVETV